MSGATLTLTLTLLDERLDDGRRVRARLARKGDEAGEAQPLLHLVRARLRLRVRVRLG